MNTRKLGSQGLLVSELGYGCMGLSDFYSTSATDDKTAIDVIHRAIDLGATFLDTADMYGPHKNETLVGKALRGLRNQVVLATKFGVLREGGGPPKGVNGRPDYVRTACDASLKRLGVDHIDLYYQHRVDADVPIEETVGAMADLVKQGKVLYLGLSEALPATIRRAFKVHPISALQTEYSLWSRDPEDEILPTVRELGIGFVAYSPLGRGFLAGRFNHFEDLARDDFRRTSPRLQGENFARNLALVDKVREIAAEKGCTAAQLALAWLLARGADIVPIPGTSHRGRLEENLGAVQVSLDAEDLARIDAIAPKGVAIGERYNAAGMSTLNR